jgi:hypothetical protein
MTALGSLLFEACGGANSMGGGVPFEAQRDEPDAGTAAGLPLVPAERSNDAQPALGLDEVDFEPSFDAGLEGPDEWVADGGVPEAAPVDPVEASPRARLQARSRADSSADPQDENGAHPLGTPLVSPQTSAHSPSR